MNTDTKINLVFFFSIQKNVLYQDTLFAAIHLLLPHNLYNVKFFDPHGIGRQRYPDCDYIPDLDQLIIDSVDSLILLSYYQDIDYLLTNLPESSNFKIVNLWHGMPIRTINLLNEIESQLEVFNKIRLHSNKIFHLVYEKPYIDVFSMAFDAPRNHIFTIGNLRTTSGTELFFENNFKNILFAPSFDIYSSYESICARMGVNATDQQLNDFLVSHSIYLHIKQHNLEIPLLSKNKYSNIFIFDQFTLDIKKTQLFKFLHQFDLLISDFSSLIIDFTYFEKPIFINKPTFMNPDLLKYIFPEGFIYSESTDDFSVFSKQVYQKLFTSKDFFTESFVKYLEISNFNFDSHKLNQTLSQIQLYSIGNHS